MKLFIAACCAFNISLNASNPNTDSILDGSTLLNLKKANSNAFYKYLIADNCYTLIKFKKGKVVDYCFNSLSHNTYKIDTFYYTNKSGLAIKINKKVRNPANVLRISYSKDLLYLCIAADDTLSTNYYGNRFYYYSNKQLCVSEISNPTHDTIYEKKYTRKGVLSSVIIKSTDNVYNEATIFTNQQTIDFIFRSNKEVRVREQYDGKGHLIQVDSTDAEYKHIGTQVSYYVNKNIKEKITYKDGVPDGIGYSYYENGTLKTTETFILGKKVGKYIYYNKDGTIKKEGVYK